MRAKHIHSTQKDICILVSLRTGGDRMCRKNIKRTATVKSPERQWSPTGKLGLFCKNNSKAMRVKLEYPKEETLLLAMSNPGAPSFVLGESDSNGLPHLLKNFSQELTLCQRNYGTFLKTFTQALADVVRFITHARSV